MKESKKKFFPRDRYFDELMERFIAPIGKATVFSITHDCFDREFMEFPINSVPMADNRGSKNLYRHQEYFDLMCEVYQTESVPGNVDKKMFVLFDFANDTMIVASKQKIGAINEGYPVAIKHSVKNRIFQDYRFNAFPHQPFGTIESLIDLIPSNKAILSHSDDYAPKNDHQRDRTKWLYTYVDDMFCTKASSLYHQYSTPHITNPDVICIKGKHCGNQDDHSMLIGDVSDGTLLDVKSIYHTGMIEGRREYFINKRYMTPEDHLQFKNVQFLIEQNEILRPNTVLNLDTVNLRDKGLSETINVATLPALTPQ